MTTPTRRVKYLAKEINERCGVQILELLSVSATRGVIPRSEITSDEPRADDLSNYKICRPGDIVVNRMSAYQGALGSTSCEGIVSPDYLVLRPSSRVQSRWLHYLMKSSWFVSEMSSRLRGIGSIGTSNVRTPRVSAEEIGEIAVSVPTFEAQRAIADYLDTETARIDALIAKKQRMSELLSERLEAEREVAILEVAGARVCSLRWLLCEAISDGPHETPNFVDEGVPFLSVDNIVDSEVQFDGCRMISEQDHARYSRKLKPRFGDVLITKAASVGKVALVKDQREFNIWSPIAVLRTDVSVLLPEFLWLYLRTQTAQRELKLGSTSNTQQNISMRDLGSLRVPVIPTEIQRSICERFRTDSTQVLDHLGASVSRLREYRQALITAAVTGELEIPGVAA